MPTRTTVDGSSRISASYWVWTDRLGGDRSEQFGAWRRFFEAISAQGTTVLAFEDLQWADDGLLDLIDSLFEWSRHHPCPGGSMRFDAERIGVAAGVAAREGRRGEAVAGYHEAARLARQVDHLGTLTDLLVDAVFVMGPDDPVRPDSRRRPG